MEHSSILDSVKKHNVKFVNLVFTDIMGSTKSVTIPVHRLPEALEKGVWFDGSSIEGFARIQESDMVLKLDENCFSIVPYQTNGVVFARFFCDVYNSESRPYSCDPRHVLRTALERLEKKGYVYNTGPELEFFLFRRDANHLEPVLHDFGGYFDDAPRDLASKVRTQITLNLEEMGIETEMSHHEVAPGQQEIDFKYDNALKTADNAITFKQVVKATAAANDLYATFMPKPRFGISGSGMHVHQSLFDIERKKNAFYGEGNKYHLSEIAMNFIAGQLKYAREISIVLSPNVNSYKRLTPGYEAPVYICWAAQNRSALIRVPSYFKGRENARRAELRCPDPSCNPYLAFAVMLEAGMHGIKENLQLPEATEEDVYHFNEAELERRGIQTMPGSLGQAIDYAKKSELLRGTFGEELFEKYINAKKKEWNQYRIVVSRWELEKYFEVL